MAYPKLLVWARPDGGVSVTEILWPKRDDESEAEFLARVEGLLKTPTLDMNGGGTPAIPADWVRVAAKVRDELPKDRTFRAAWTADSAGVKVDMPKAREIHKELMRVARAPKLAALDVEQMRGRNVEAQKQALRDVTSDPAIDAAQTPEQLKSVWPSVLNG